MKNTFELDIINKELIKRFMNTNNSLLITGKAWTGKTELMKTLLELSTKNSIILAPNKFEAVKSDRLSIESFLKIPENVVDFNILKKIEYSFEHIDFIKKLDLIAIDEVASLSSQMLDILDVSLQQIRENSEPLGGIQLVLVGDLCETLPFLNKTQLDTINKQWKSEYFFDSKCYNTLNMEYFDLGGIYNKNLHFDTENLYFLIGNNNIQTKYLEYFNRLFYCNDNKDLDKLVLTVDDCSADKINKEKLEKLANYEKYSFACDVYGEFNMNMSPVEPIINLKKGAKVILVNNYAHNLDYENGTIGIFDGMEDGQLCILTDNKKILVNKTSWTNYEFGFDGYSNDCKIELGTIVQYPIKLGWAISIKDSKGMAFKNLHFENKDVQVLENSQAYSFYCRTFDNRNDSVSIPFRRCDIKSDERVLNFLFNNVYKDKHVFQESDID